MVNMNCNPLLHLHYHWNGETRRRCFCVQDGEPILVDCNINRSEKPHIRGLGDVIAAATSAVGIQPCAGCKQRQEALNKLVPFNTTEEGNNNGSAEVGSQPAD